MYKHGKIYGKIYHLDSKTQGIDKTKTMVRP